MDFTAVLTAIIGALVAVGGGILAARSKRGETLNDRAEWEVRLILEQRDIQVRELREELVHQREIIQRYAFAYHRETGRWLWPGEVPPRPGGDSPENLAPPEPG